MPRRFDGISHQDRQAAEYLPNRCESDDGTGWIFTHFPEGAPLRDAKMGMCGACGDVTVLPAFANGCCFGCMSAGLADEEPIAEPRHVFYEHDAADPIAEIFAEAQISVPMHKVIANMLGPNGSMIVRGGPLLLRRAVVARQARARCESRSRWGIVPASLRVTGAVSARSAINAYYKDLRAAHLAVGLCIHCITQALPGLTICEKHYAPIKAKHSARKAAGACLGCGGARDTDKGTCSTCIARLSKAQRARAERLLAAGLCTACGKRPAAPKWCIECTEKKNAARRAKAQALRPPRTYAEICDSARRANAARWGKRQDQKDAQP